ncbi:MAG: N-acetylmuramoyl-L-alanine amidase [Candidatus Krumholzibacteriota bacterium]|nr:N-acetylmuramoyl-L-alanine amidase [Candidatus Krumholzibacteriota bacterium]
MEKNFLISFGKLCLKNRKRLAFYTIFAAAALLLYAGCASRHSKYIRLYSSLSEKRPTLEQRVLVDRKIVIDPGHGGNFKGALGADSLSEAEVNLGVALYLWGLLDEAGADVKLTRTTDRDFLSEDSKDLKDDLKARVEEANSYNPEVFISIHHNSTLPVKRDKNRIEIYYNSKDSGASLELAQLVRLHLARNLGIENSRINPGNYYVLRNSTGQASILGEASYISNPAVEGKLKLSSKQQLEAESYFIALVNYFSRGVPVLKLISTQADTVYSNNNIVFKIKRGNNIPIDPASSTIYFDGKANKPSLDINTQTLHFGITSDTPNKIHTVRASVKSVRGATATSGLHTFVLNRPPVHFLPLPPKRGSDKNIILSVKILDKFGNPIIDGSHALISPLDSEKKYSEECNNGMLSFCVKESLLPGNFTVDISGRNDTLYFPQFAPSKTRTLKIVSSGDNSVIPFPLVYTGKNSHTLKGDGNGIVHLPDSLPKINPLIIAGGFKPFTTDINAFSEGKETIVIKLPPLFEGKLNSRRIAIDPACGGAYGGTSGKKMIKESSINLRIAKQVSNILKTSGAFVYLTREGEETLSQQERIAGINRFYPELSIQINHDLKLDNAKGAFSIRHYPDSQGGTKIAAIINSNLEGLYLAESGVIKSSASSLLSQTSCPACEIHFTSLDEKEFEEIASDPDYINLISENIFSSILNYFNADHAEFNPVKIKITSKGRGIPDVYVTVDNLLTLPTNDRGIAVFSHIDPGKHMIVVQTRGEEYRWGMYDVQAETENEILIELKDD